MLLEKTVVVLSRDLCVVVCAAKKKRCAIREGEACRGVVKLIILIFFSIGISRIQEIKH